MPVLSDFCGRRYPIGLFYFDKRLWTDEGVKQAAETGADFLVAVESQEPLYRLCSKYGLGIVSSSNIVPTWWGGKGENPGGYEKLLPLQKLDDGMMNYPSSSALWGDYPADEPNSKDFAHINRVAKRYSELLPNKLPFINVYPNYGCVPQNNTDEIYQQLGNETYSEYINQYIRDIDLPYICFDFYPFTGAFATYLENLDIVASACKKSKKEMWVIIQAGAWKPEQALNAHQLDWQVYMCLAYGARSIIHASYSNGWWDESTSCVNQAGQKNRMYGYVKNINAVLHSSFGKDFLEYDHLFTDVCGAMDSSDSRIRSQLMRQNAMEKPPTSQAIKLTSDKAVVVGHFKKGEDYAFLIVNSHNPVDGFATAHVKLEVGGTPPAETWKTAFTLQSGQGTFLALKSQRAAQQMELS